MLQVANMSQTADDCGSSGDGIVIEMASNNDLWINASHLTVRCSACLEIYSVEIVCLTAL